MSEMKREAERLTDLDEIRDDLEYHKHYREETPEGDTLVLVIRCLLAVAERLEWIDQDMRPDRPTDAQVGVRDADNILRTVMQGVEGPIKGKHADVLKVDDLTVATGPMKAEAMDKFVDDRPITEDDLPMTLVTDQVWQIWSEGYRATGQSAKALFHGTIRATSFLEACKNFAANHTAFAAQFDVVRMTYWACRLFPTEEEARRSFG